MTKGVDLHRLQDLDSEGDEKRRRLEEVETALSDSEALRQAKRRVETFQKRVQEWVVEQRDLELQVQGLTDKISHEEQRLYSGMIKNPKELGDIQAEVAALKRRRQELESTLLETMIEREGVEAGQAEAQTHLNEVQADWSAGQADLIGEQEELQKKLAEIAQIRIGLLSSIDAGDLALYESLRIRKGGVAVAELRDGTCGRCGVGVSPSVEWQLRQGKLVPCSNCERIIVRL
jgi:predicted  nucleic acid-binding Zn-ribbon protein